MEYQQLVETYDKLLSTSKRLEKTYHLSEILSKTKEDDLNKIILLLQGRVFPNYDERKIGIAAKLMVKVLSKATGATTTKIESLWRKKGDLGDVAEEVTKNKTQSTLFQKKLTVDKVFNNIQKVASIEGHGTIDKKISLIAELITSSTPSEAKYIVRTVLEDLRVGVAEGTLRDAITWAFFPKVYGIFYKCDRCHKIMPKTKRCLYCTKELPQKFTPQEPNFKDIEHLPDEEFIYTESEQEARNTYNQLIEEVQQAYDILNDFGEVAQISKKEGIKGLRYVSLRVNRPMKQMLYLKAEDFRDAFERVGEKAEIEYKYDGFRVQIHKDKDKIKLFTRRLEDVTPQFPDVVENIKNNVKSDKCILDGEIIGIDKKSKKYIPFQNISQRIKRKYSIDYMAKHWPVTLRVFDIMHDEGKNLLKEPFKKRHQTIQDIIKESPNKIGCAESKYVDNIKEANEFYEESLEKGNEGVMLKNLDAPYKPGKRVGYGVKVKPSYETLDLAVVGAEWGEGKRSGWLTSYVIAVQDKDGNLKEIGKVGTGVKEKDTSGLTFQQMTQKLKPDITSQSGKEVKVKPKIVLEIQYEEIQSSPTYSSGYALRFPRVIKLREDKPTNEITTLQEIKNLYESS